MPAPSTQCHSNSAKPKQQKRPGLRLRNRSVDPGERDSTQSLVIPDRRRVIRTERRVVGPACLIIDRNVKVEPIELRDQEIVIRMEQSVYLVFAITTACVSGVEMVLSGFVLKLLLDNIEV